jgi:hypothetical protein
MADDEDAIAPALETASEGQEQIETELETGDDQQPEDGEPLGEDEDELDFGFEKYRVPKKLKEAVEALRSDATNKHQTAAARQRALDERETALTQQAEATEAELDAKAGLRTINREIERLKDYDFAAYQQHYRQDPMPAGELWAYKQDLMAQKAELEGTLGKAATERTEKAQQDFAKRVQQTLAEAPKIIPGFKPEAIGKIAEFLERDIGLDEQTIKNNWSPKLLKLAHLANLGLELSKKAAAKPAVVSQAQPLTTVSTRTPPNTGRLRDDMPIEEWTKAREAQLRRKRA